MVIIWTDHLKKIILFDRYKILISDVHLCTYVAKQHGSKDIHEYNLILSQTFCCRIFKYPQLLSTYDNKVNTFFAFRQSSPLSKHKNYKRHEFKLIKFGLWYLFELCFLAEVCLQHTFPLHMPYLVYSFEINQLSQQIYGKTLKVTTQQTHSGVFKYQIAQINISLIEFALKNRSDISVGVQYLQLFSFIWILLSACLTTNEFTSFLFYDNRLSTTSDLHR